MTSATFDFASTDTSSSGVYMVEPIDLVSIDAAASDAGWQVFHVNLRGCDGKDALMQSMTQALGAPDFGSSWGGLHRALRYLSWSDASGHVLLFENGVQFREANSEVYDALLDQLDDVAAQRAELGTPFWCFFAMPATEFSDDD